MDQEQQHLGPPIDHLSSGTPTTCATAMATTPSPTEAGDTRRFRIHEHQP